VPAGLFDSAGDFGVILPFSTAFFVFLSFDVVFVFDADAEAASALLCFAGSALALFSGAFVPPVGAG
jgi:hypothetical protein